MDLLSGIKIFDFTRLLPGPIATLLLAQMGAEVIKIESPKRLDYVRFSGPQIDDASFLYHQLNHNKTLHSIDYSNIKGKNQLLEHIKNADVLIEQFRPGAMDAWGLGYKEIKKINPNIVYVSITGYGQDNDYSNEAGHDLNYLAYSGVLSLMKDDQGKPNISDTQFADISGAYMTVIATQSAIIKKLKTGKGSFVDVSLTDAMNPFLTLPYSLFQGGIDQNVFNLINGKTTVNYAVYICKDGKWLTVAAMEIKFWNNICDVLKKPDWKRKSPIDLMNHSFPKEEVEQLFKNKTRDEWLNVFKGHDVCIAPVLELEELRDSNYHKTKHTFQNLTTKKGSNFKAIKIPFNTKN